jgi:hypothetical protein
MTVRLLRLGCRSLPGLALLAAASFAQAQGAPARPDPLDPRSPVPAFRYSSPLADYRTLGDDKRVPWKEANDTVKRIGGWRAYAREAQAPEPAASAPRTPAAAGHKSH